MLLGAISILTAFSLDVYLPAPPAIAADPHASACAVQLTCSSPCSGSIFSNGFALALAHFGNAAGTASALFGSLQFLFAGIAGTAVGARYDGTPRAMAGAVCMVAVAAAVLYRSAR